MKKWRSEELRVKSEEMKKGRSEEWLVKKWRMKIEEVKKWRSEEVKN